MNYVRTNNNEIWSFCSEKNCYVCKGKAKSEKHLRKIFSEGSDKLDDLCDEFIAIKQDKNGKFEYAILTADEYKSGEKWHMHVYYCRGYSIYGAMYGSFGPGQNRRLVIKLNDKGEWELL